VKSLNSAFLFGIAAAGLFFSAVAIYYINVLKNTFRGLRRLERPWSLLELGVISLVAAALTFSVSGISNSTGILHLVQVVAVVASAFFILAAMVTMKQAWTIKETD